MLIDDVSLIKKEDLLGKIIAFSTDTVFGVGAIISDTRAIDKIYRLKNRDYSKPLAILAATIDDILPYVKDVSEEVLNIMYNYWPGALTIIFKKSQLVDKIITNGLSNKFPSGLLIGEIISLEEDYYGISKNKKDSKKSKKEVKEENSK